MKRLILLLMIIPMLSSCMKEELPVSKKAIGNGKSFIATLKIGKSYGDQLYYSIENNKTVMLADRNSWDLAFETSAEGFHVLMNNGRSGGMRLLNTTDFSAVKTDNTSDWGYDSPTDSFDSTFVGDWRNTQNIYLFYLGVSADGTDLGKYKFRILSVDATQYVIEYCKLNATNPIQAIIPKRANYNFSLFSFISGQEVTAQASPQKTDFDLCIRTYTYIYPDGIPYLVVGCLLNNYNTSATLLKSKTNFNDVTYEDAISVPLSSDVDAIGFTWKEYGFDVTYYTVYPNLIYIVKTQNGKYYKLHFLDYYDEQGEKGSPKLEIQELLP